jgi:penicillin-binding protein 2
VTEASTRRRLVVIGAIVMALFAGLLTRLWFLQVSGGEALAVQAQQNRDHPVAVPALRGTIYDAKGNWLARTVPVTALTVDRQKLTASDRVLLMENLPTLPDFAGKSVVEIGKLIDDTSVSPYLPVAIATNPSPDTVVYVAEHRELFPQVSVTHTSVREYSDAGIAAANLIGYTGEINDAEMEAHVGERYETGDTIGKTGVEQTFESELRGVPGRDKVQVDNLGRAVDTITVRKPHAGHDVQLTLDGDVQKIALESLQQGIDGSRRLVDPDTGNYYEPTGGAVMVLDARTGSVVAMASAPNFNPNDFIAGRGDAYIKDTVNKPMLDRATTAVPPGSTFKMITSVAMLKSGLEPDGKNFTLYDPGYFDFGNDQRLYNAGGAELGKVNLARALTVSSDVYFYKVGNDFWVQYRNEGQAAGRTGDLAGDELPDSQHPVGNAIQHTAREFGFGELTGIGFGESPDLSAGITPNHEYRAEVNKNSTDRFSRAWLRGDSANLAVGQGDVLVTPLQLALAYATLGNGGALNVPRVASAVRQSAATLPDGQLGAVDHTIDRQVRRKVDLPPEVRDPILEGLHGAVNSGEGTAYGAFADYVGYSIVGKTGTAQGNAPGKDTAWFVGILNPENNPNQPQYVVLAMVEHGGFGAAVAAPIVRRVVNFLTDPTVAPAPVSVAPASGNEESN